MTGLQQAKKQLEGWFASSFWVDMHYALSAAGTVILLATYAFSQKFDLGFAGFVTSMWATALANDKVNMPPIPGKEPP
jgi:hypothetical protein